MMMVTKRILSDGLDRDNLTIDVLKKIEIVMVLFSLSHA